MQQRLVVKEKTELNNEKVQMWIRGSEMSSFADIHTVQVASMF